MREIDVTAPPSTRFLRALVLGAPKAGKTHFAASAPAPLFISDAAEGGFATLQSMDSALWWDPKVKPTVWALENIFADMPPILSKLEKLKAEGQFPWKTIVVDPLSIYADRVFAEMHALATIQARNEKRNFDPRHVYGDLAMHLRSFMMRVHAMPCHVLWLCHVKDGGVALAGQTADKLPAMVDFIWLCNRSALMGADGKTTASHELLTQPWGAFSSLGGRWAVRNSQGVPFGLPSPMIPSFKAIAQIFQLGEPVSPAMPGLPKGAKYTWPPEPQPEAAKEGGT